MDEIRINFHGKLDKKGKEYYVAVCHVPASIDLRNTVLLLFPHEEADGKFGGEMVVKIFNKRESV